MPFAGALKPFLTRLVALLGLLAVVALPVTAPAPVLAQDSLWSDLLLNEQQEKELAEQEHPKVLEQFGGEYDDPELHRYVQSLVDFLGQTSNRPDIQYKVTILNSPVVNAFALPAGYVYVTRGLLALADNEAEVAGVLAHEIGHVTARHTAERYSRGMVAQGLAGILGAVTQGTNLGGLGQIAQVGALAWVQKYSRDNEHEADLLGIQTMARAGFDPRAMSSFLSKLEAKSNLDARLAGQSGQEQFNLFATHPRTADRVNQAIQQAQVSYVRDPMQARDIYLDKISGLLYGDDPEQGFVRGRTFAHPELGFQFTVPEGFQILNGQAEVVAQGPEGAGIKFDAVGARQGVSPLGYLQSVWAEDLPLQSPEQITINGMTAATGLLHSDGDAMTPGKEMRLVAIDAGGGRLYRFLFVAPSNIASALRDDFRETAQSFRRLSAGERDALNPYRVVIHQVRQGETVSSLARSTPLQRDPEAQFRVLNGLAPGQEVVPGQRVKLVVGS